MDTEAWQFFLVGCVGAIAPEIVRLYNLRFQARRLRLSWNYILVSIFFVLLGGFVAWILEPSNNYTAFYSGISTPVLVTTVAKNTGQGIPTPDYGVEQPAAQPDEPLSKGGNTGFPTGNTGFPSPAFGRPQQNRTQRVSWRDFWNAL
ncbi:MAG: hypothetical protein AAFY26_13630 [Cyanobacteria bacterium J06638_22]